MNLSLLELAYVEVQTREDETDARLLVGLHRWAFPHDHHNCVCSCGPFGELELMAILSPKQSGLLVIKPDRSNYLTPKKRSNKLFLLDKQVLILECCCREFVPSPFFSTY